MPYWLALFVLYGLMLWLKYEGNVVSQHILSNNCQLSDYLLLSAQIVTPLLFYLLLIFAILKVGRSLFVNLPQQLGYESLNRLAGDIAALDRSVTINTF